VNGTGTRRFPVAGVVVRAIEVFSILILIIMKLYRAKRHRINKVKFTLEQVTKFQKGEKISSSTLSLTSVLGRDGWLTPRPTASYPRKKPGS